MELELAWQRVKQDIKSRRPFITFPFECELIELDLEGWLKSTDLTTFNPSSSIICDTPKGNHLIRPGTHLIMEDRLVYTYIVSKFLPLIISGLSWSQNKVDFANLLAEDINSHEWIKKSFTGWDNFRIRSLSTIQEGYKYVVVTDLAAYYENISIKILISDLKELGIEDSLSLNLLQKCLKKWSPTGEKGLPQGHTASDILSKVYLNSFDYHLRNLNYIHLRYSDDIRVFCKNIIDAKKAIIEISKYLRMRGLSLQSAKTKILTSSQAKKEFAEKTSTILQLKSRLPRIIYMETGQGNPYMSDFDAKTILENMEKFPIDLVRNTYKYYFQNKYASKKFNKSLFHYVLKLLSESKDEYAVKSCLLYLAELPEETKFILDYFSSIAIRNPQLEVIVNYLSSSQAIYPYQNFLIINWFLKKNKFVNNNLLNACRTFTFDRAHPSYVRSAARCLVSLHGNSADLERIKMTYSEADSEQEKAEIICSLTRMESGKRNAFYSEIKDEGELQRRAIIFTKNYLTPALLSAKPKP